MPGSAGAHALRGHSYLNEENRGKQNDETTNRLEHYAGSNALHRRGLRRAIAMGIRSTDLSLRKGITKESNNTLR